MKAITITISIHYKWNKLRLYCLCLFIGKPFSLTEQIRHVNLVNIFDYRQHCAQRIEYWLRKAEMISTMAI